MFFKTPIVPDTSSSCSSCCPAINWCMSKQKCNITHLALLLMHVRMVRYDSTCCCTCCSSIKWELAFCRCRSSLLYLSVPGCQAGTWLMCSHFSCCYESNMDQLKNVATIQTSTLIWRVRQWTLMSSRFELIDSVSSCYKLLLIFVWILCIFYLLFKQQQIIWAN